jgi:hypothetical protein
MWCCIVALILEFFSARSHCMSLFSFKGQNTFPTLKWNFLRHFRNSPRLHELKWNLISIIVRCSIRLVLCVIKVRLIDLVKFSIFVSVRAMTAYKQIMEHLRPLFLKLGNRRRRGGWVVRITTPRLLYPQAKRPFILWIGESVETGTGMEVLEKG